MLDISGRVQTLRKEIADIQATHEVFKYKRTPEAAVEWQGRALRLREIQIELGSILKKLKPEDDPRPPKI